MSALKKDRATGAGVTLKKYATQFVAPPTYSPNPPTHQPSQSHVDPQPHQNLVIKTTKPTVTTPTMMTTNPTATPTRPTSTTIITETNGEPITEINLQTIWILPKLQPFPFQNAISICTSTNLPSPCPAYTQPEVP